MPRWADDHSRAVDRGAEGAAARSPGRRPAARDDRRAGPGDRAPAAADRSRELGEWFVESADSGSLERYLETFDHTVAVMQTDAAITRVASECVQDLAADGVVYAEIRYAPEQHLDRRAQPGAGRRRGPRRASSTAWRTPSGPDRRPPAADRDAAPGPLDGDRRAVRRLPRRRASSGSTSPARRRATRPPGTWTRSSTCSARTRTSPSTPARPSACRRSGRRSSGAAPTGSATASGSSTTSPRTRTAASSSAGWRRTCVTAGSRSRCARAATCRPARPRRSPTTRSAC